MSKGFATLFGPSPARRPRELVEAAIEALIALLDAIDGDTDREAVCEDEGAQCEDEGATDDREQDYADCG